MTLLTDQDFNRELVEAIEDHFEIIRLNQTQNPDAEFKFTIKGSNSEFYTEDMDGLDFIYSDDELFGGTNALFGGAYASPFEAYDELLNVDTLLEPSTVIEFDFEGRDVYRLDHRTNGSFVLTADLNEVAYVLENLEYDYTEVAFRVGEGEVHRFFNPETGHHNFAGNSIEALAIIQSDGAWLYEGTL